MNSPHEFWCLVATFTFGEHSTDDRHVGIFQWSPEITEDEGEKGGRTSVDVQQGDLIQVGLVTVGDILVGKRPGVTGQAAAIVLDAGAIELENGQRFTALSTAAMSLGLGVTINGWQYWVHERTGKLLSKLREKYLGRLGDQDPLFDVNG